MTTFEAFVLGIIQGLTEFLPVSSSGHIELGKALFGVANIGIDFTVLVHLATALASVIIFRVDIGKILSGMMQFSYNDSWSYALKLLLSAVPIAIVGLFFKDRVEGFFTGNLALVGSMLLVTAALLFFTSLVKRSDKQIGWGHAFVIGIAQTIAILPGISRSGATIAMALLMNIDKVEAAKFSFLMVLIPIFGQALLDGVRIYNDPSIWTLPTGVTLAAFMGAFASGLFACAAMLKIVRQGKLYYFSVYCVVVGIVAIVA